MSDKIVLTNSNTSHRMIRFGSVALLASEINLAVFNAYVVIFLELDLGTTIAFITIIVSLRNILQLFLRVPLGELSQIIGRKPLIIFGDLSYVIALGLLFIATDWFFVLIATLILAIGMASFWPALFSFIGDVSQDKNNYGENNGRIFQGGDLGAIIGSLIAVILLDTFKTSLQELFGFIFLLGIMFVIIISIILPESLPLDQRKKVENIGKALYLSFRNMISGLKKITTTKGMGIIYLWQFTISFLEFTISVFWPVLIISKGFTNKTVAEITLWGTIILIWFKPRLGKISDKFGFERPVFVTVLLSAVILYLMVIVNDLLIHIILFAILFGSLITAYTAVNGATAKTAPISQRGLALGALGFWVSSGRTSSTIVLGPIWDIFDINAVFLITASFFILTALIIFYRNFIRTKLSFHSKNETTTN